MNNIYPKLSRPFFEFLQDISTLKKTRLLVGHGKPAHLKKDAGTTDRKNHPFNIFCRPYERKRIWFPPQKYDKVNFKFLFLPISQALTNNTGNINI